LTKSEKILNIISFVENLC